MPRPKRKGPLTKEWLIQFRNIDPLTGCWIWTRSQKGKGYGQCGQKLTVHRAAYELFIGPIPEGMEVLHHCDVRSCFNPDHLFLGTNLDNIKDSWEKGRWTGKLTAQTIRTIKSDPGTVREIGRRFGIHFSNVSRLKSGKTYRWAS